MKTMKKVFIGIVAIPLFLIIFEIFGMIVNHASTSIQTNCLRRDIVDAIPNTGKDVSIALASDAITSLMDQQLDEVKSEMFLSLRKLNWVASLCTKYYTPYFILLIALSPFQEFKKKQVVELHISA